VHGRFEVQQWLHWQMANLGPISGQCGHFRNYAPESVPYAIDRFTREVNRLYGVMDQRLADREFLAGDYSIADMASWPWVRPWKRYDQKLDDFPHLRDWFRRMESRPAVQKAIKIGADLLTQQPPAEEARKILFGQTAAVVR
jgi:GST-like protein